MILRLRAGGETLILGPRAAFAAVAGGRHGGLLSEYEVRRRLRIALADRETADALRRAFARWREEGARIREADDGALIDRVARMSRNGTLVAFIVADRSKQLGSAAAGGAPARPLSITAPSDAATLSGASLKERIAMTLGLVPNHLTGATKEEFAKLVEPKALATTVEVLAIWAVSHAFGVGEAIDAVLLAAGIYFGGAQLWRGAQALLRALELMRTAQSVKQLDDAAAIFADGVANVGIAVLIAALTHGAAKKAGRWTEKKPSLRNTPQEKAPKPERYAERPASRSQNGGVAESIVDTPTEKRWNAWNGPGPVGEDYAKTFRSASYTEKVTTRPQRLYRAYSDPDRRLGAFWTDTPPKGPLQSQMDSALLPEWGNEANNVVCIEIPPGTRIFEGFAAPQTGEVGARPSLLGGGRQIIVEPKIDPSWVR